MFDDFSICEFIIDAAQAILGVSLIICFVRVVRGPTTPDRVVALDVTASLIVGLIALDAIATDQTVFLRAALVVALMSFLATVSFASFLRKGGKQ